MRIFSFGAYVIVFERKASNQDDDGAPSEGRREVLDIGANNAIYCFLDDAGGCKGRAKGSLGRAII
jgi:hypothetical protein